MGLMKRTDGMDARKDFHVFLPLKPQRLSEEVYRQLKDAILEGHYKPGDKLPSEKSFCETFGVGRPVVREALRSLENSGLISVRPGAGGGALVQKIDSSILAGTFEGIVKMDNVSLEELTEARLALEMGALPLVFRRISPEDLDELERNLEEVRQNLARGIRGKRNLGFHVVLLKASGNQLLSKIAEALMGLMGRLLEDYEYSTERSREVLKIHEQLIQLLRTKQYDKATQLLDAHIKDTFHLFRRQTGSGHRSGRKKTAEGGGHGNV
jgi:GntR family transcriptional regulator, transcriptional repressor for pyruvate dehydrogenase complex